MPPRSMASSTASLPSALPRRPPRMPTPFSLRRLLLLEFRPSSAPRATVTASALGAGAADDDDDDDDGEEEDAADEGEFNDEDVDDDDDDDDLDDDIIDLPTTTTTTAATLSGFREPENDPVRPWELDLPTVDQILEDPDWPSYVKSWPRFWALYGLWREHLFRREHSTPPLTKEEKKNPRARGSALWERALRLAPPDGAEDVNILFAEGVWDDGSGGEGGEGSGGGEGVEGEASAADGASGGGEDADGASNTSTSSPPSLSARDAEEALYAARGAKAEAREAARLAALPPMLAADQRRWREGADRLDARIFDAVCAIHAALPELMAAKVPVPERLEDADQWRALFEPELEGVVVPLTKPRDPTILPTYHTGGVMGGTNVFPGPRAPAVEHVTSRTAIANQRKLGLETIPRGDITEEDPLGFSREEMEEEERARERASFSDGAVLHAWSTWGDVELRAWNEKRRAHARADAAFAAKQALVGRDKGFNVDEITDLRMAKKVVGLLPRRFKLTWTHEEIMGVITNGGQNVHPDVAAPALGVCDPARNLDYWEEGIHLTREFAADLDVAGILKEDDEEEGEDDDGNRWLRDFSDDDEDEEGAGGSGRGRSGRSKSGGVEVEAELADDDEELAAAGPSAAASSKASSSSSKASKTSSSATLAPFPTAAATSADLAETFAGLSDDDDDEDDDEIVLEDDDDDDDGSGSDIEIGGLPGVDVDPEFDENSV